MSVAPGDPVRIGRVAFLTPEFVTERPSGGGVASYVAKMAVSLVAQGIETEVFVPSSTDDTVSYAGITVHRVSKSRSLPARVVARATRPLVGGRGEVWLELLTARRLAAALERRHLQAPFDVVQSSNYQLTGAFVQSSKRRRHLVRVSTSRRLYDADGPRLVRIVAGWTERLDVRIMRRSDASYAPSRFLASYFEQRYRVPMQLIRPPAELGADVAEEPPAGLPERYLLHFGSLGPRKGTDWVAAALMRAWADEPDLRMVWAGSLDPRAWARYRTAWGSRVEQVTWLGPLPKPLLYRAAIGSLAAVLPSRVDNLPNTVIESLRLGVPVIGSAGASIDELVEDGVSGRLVEIGDARGLAAAMVAAWRGGSPWCERGFRDPPVFAEMAPPQAVARFLALAGGEA